MAFEYTDNDHYQLLARDRERLEVNKQCKSLIWRYLLSKPTWWGSQRTVSS